MSERDQLERDPALRVQTLGRFRLWREGAELPASIWERDKALQLFQFLIARRRRLLERERIVEQLWPECDPETGERDFKVALSSALRSLEPDRRPRAESRFVRRVGTAYGLAEQGIEIDAEQLEQAITEGNRSLADAPGRAKLAYRRAVDLYRGDFLPDRRYEDWASLEQERLQTLALGAMANLGQLVLEDNPLESLELAQRILSFDPIWEEAWRLEMRAHMARGNRGLALRSWERCRQALDESLGIEPLPVTRAVYEAALDPTGADVGEGRAAVHSRGRRS